MHRALKTETQRGKFDNTLDDTIKQALINIVGPESFTDSLIDLVSYSYDASDHDCRPEVAVWPQSAEQVSRIVVLANESRFPVIPRGAGTGFAGGAVPVRGGLILDLCRMNKILDLSLADRLVVVQPGVVYADLQRYLNRHGFFFPPDPASGRVCTIGGNAATNASGLRGAKYGATRDYVVRLEVVLPLGTLMRTGSRCLKSSSGYNLTGLLVGSEGTLGVITEITLKVNPNPVAHRTGLAFFDSLEGAGRTVVHVIESGIVPSILEIRDGNAIKVLRQYGEMDLPDAGAMILAETDGFSPSEASCQMEKILDVFRKNKALSIQTADSPQGVERLWTARKSVGSIAGRLRPNNVSEDVTVPVSKVPQLLRELTAMIGKYGFPFVIFGHAGDGNLHPKVMYDRSDAQQARQIRKMVTEIFELTCALGGTISGEHGVGLEKAPFMMLEHDEAALQMMLSFKKMLDPNNILNPGKMGHPDGPVHPEGRL
jgi:glycolate oxidase